jgi:hypothetical protein
MKILLFGVFSLVGAACLAQGLGAGAAAPSPPQTPDTNMIFQSPRPLIQPAGILTVHHAWGIDILFSNDGFGAGVFYRNYYSREITGFADIEFSGVKSPNENDMYFYDPYTGLYYGPQGKLNDIYMIPMAIGMQYRLFADALSDAFRPYINAGVGPTVLIAAPDSLSFFTGFAHASVVVVPEFYVGLGANFGKDPHAVSGVNFRYYYIRYGPGIQSLAGVPITDFGGFFITINWGLGF